MFESRSTQKEIMDDLHFEGEVMTKTLRELEVINTLLGGNNVTITALEKLYVKGFLKSGMTLGDLGCGGGDILKLIAGWARKKNLQLKLIGIDANEFIIEYAKNNTRNFPEITYVSVNIFSEQFKDLKFDIINCTLFCHHFTSDELTVLFTQLRLQTHTALVINDLHRHWFAYHSIKWLTYIFSGSYMVKNDAKLSVLRSFKKMELVDIFKKSGYKDFEIQWRWAFRYRIIILNR